MGKKPTVHSNVSEENVKEMRKVLNRLEKAGVTYSGDISITTENGGAVISKQEGCAVAAAVDREEGQGMGD